MRLVVYLAMRQLFDRKLLNSIAVFGVALGVAALITMNGIMQGFQMKFKGEILRVSPHVTIYGKELAAKTPIAEQWARDRGAEGVVLAHVSNEQPNDRTGSIKRPQEIARALEAMPEVEAACVGLNGQAILSFGAKTFGVDVRGVNPEDQNRCTPLVGYVVEGNYQVFAGNRDAIALGQGVSTELGAHAGDHVQIVSPGGQRVAFTVETVFDTGIPAVDRSRVYVHLPQAQNLFRRGVDIGRIEVRLRDPFLSERFAARAEVLSGYDAEGWQEANANFLSLFDMQNAIVKLVIGTVLTVGGFGILAIQVMLVLQKRRDISILRSIGLTRRDILGTILVQGFLVALTGGLIGDFLGWRMLAYLASIRVKTEGIIKSSTFLIHDDPAFYAWGIAFGLLVGLLASLAPALKASRVEPVDVLRGQIG